MVMLSGSVFVLPQTFTITSKTFTQFGGAKR